MTAPRTRVRRKIVDKGTNTIDHAKALADEIEKKQLRIAQLAEEIKADLSVLHEQMVRLGVMEVRGKLGVGERYIPSSRSSTEYDKHALFDRLGLENFLECVRVNATTVKEHMSGKELQSISKKIAGEKKKETIRVKPLESKKGG